jgi:hypothetical protein
MGIRDRSNGPSLAQATYKADRGPAPSPERRQAAQEQTMRDTAWRRRERTLFNEDKDVWYDEYFGKKDE